MAAPGAAAKLTSPGPPQKGPLLLRPLSATQEQGTDRTTAAIVSASAPARDYGRILTNADPSKPRDWQLAFASVDPSAHAEPTRIVWDGTAFVAVGGIIVTSPAGVIWTYVGSGALSTLDTITTSGGQIVVAASAGDVLVSPLGGQAWTMVSTNIDPSASMP